jgi:hypothetical protein
MEARKMAWGELKSFEKLGGRIVPPEILNVDDVSSFQHPSRTFQTPSFSIFNFIPPFFYTLLNIFSEDKS